MASAAATAALIVLVVMSSVLPTSDGQPDRPVPELLLDLARVSFDRLVSLLTHPDTAYWARKVINAERAKRCPEKGRGRPRRIPVALQWSREQPIVRRDDATEMEVAVWAVFSTGRRLTRSHMCSVSKVKEATGLNCCCCGGWFTPACCCCC